MLQSYWEDQNLIVRQGDWEWLGLQPSVQLALLEHKIVVDNAVREKTLYSVVLPEHVHLEVQIWANGIRVHIEQWFIDDDNYYRPLRFSRLHLQPFEWEELIGEINNSQAVSELQAAAVQPTKTPSS